MSKQIKLLDYSVSGSLFAGIILVWVSIFLSSCDVEAHYGNFAKPTPLVYVSNLGRLSNDNTRVAALLWQGTGSAFDRPQPGIKYIILWPQLPTVEAVRVRIAKTKLAEWMAIEKEETATKKKAVEVKLDWEAFWKGFALCLICVGAFLSLMYHPKGTPRMRRD